MAPAASTAVKTRSRSIEPYFLILADEDRRLAAEHLAVYAGNTESHGTNTAQGLPRATRRSCPRTPQLRGRTNSRGRLLCCSDSQAHSHFGFLAFRRRFFCILRFACRSCCRTESRVLRTLEPLKPNVRATESMLQASRTNSVDATKCAGPIGKILVCRLV
jgi:hypothetical protein